MDGPARWQSMTTTGVSLTHQGKTATGGGTHRPDAGMSRTNRHVHHANLVFHLPDHDAGLASVGRHPMQNSRGRAHRIGTVEFHSSCCASHGHCDVAAEHRIAVPGHRKGPGKRLEIRSCVVVAGQCNSNVFSHYGIALFLELFGENFFQCLETYAHHAESGTHCEGVLGYLVPSNVSQLGDGKGAELYALRRYAGLDRVRVVDTCGAVGEQIEVPIHRVLIQRDQQIEAIAHICHSVRAGANREKSVSAANDRLIGVICIQVQAPAAENLREDVARCCDTLARGPSDSDG